MTNSLLYDLVSQVYMYAQTNEEAPKDQIFEAEKESHRRISTERKLCDCRKMFGLYFKKPHGLPENLFFCTDREQGKTRDEALKSV